MKLMKRVTSLAVIATMCSVLAISTSAAELPEKVNPGKTELGAYMKVMTGKRSTLTEDANTTLPRMSTEKRGAVSEIQVTRQASMERGDVESEHPPLSETTKKAIAAYKKNPTEENKQAVLNALNETYDWVIQN